MRIYDYLTLLGVQVPLVIHSKHSEPFTYFHHYRQADGQWLWKKHNIERCWDYAYSGKNVVISIMDDGIEHKHPDLKQNYYAPASYDVNDGDWNPAPRYDRLNTNRHGTRCAGVVSAKAGNSICIPGIAHKSKIGGIRMLDGNVNDLVEAQSIGFGNDKIDIYVGSWGPPDDGATLEGPGYYTSHAFKRAVKYGRKNKGNIYRVVRIKQAFQKKN